MEELKKKWLCLLKTGAHDDGGTCCYCSSCKMRRRRQDFIRNGPKNGGLLLPFSNSDVYCCVLT